MKKKLFSLIAVTMAILLLFSACGGENETPSETTSPHESDSSYKAVIIQSDESPSGTEARQAFISRMRTLGYDEAKMRFDVKNAQGDSRKLEQIAASLSSSDYDLVIPIGRAAAVAVAGAQTSAPTVFISVSDPVEAGLMSALDLPDKNITGTVSKSDFDELVTLIKVLTPNVSSVAVLYTPNSSQTELDQAQQELGDGGFTVETVSLDATGDIEAAAADVLARNDAIFVLNDEALEKNISSLISLANQSGKYVFACDAGSVKNGALACVCADPEELAKGSAVLADKILRGSAVSTVPADASAEAEIFISKSACTLLGVEIPDLENSNIV